MGKCCDYLPAKMNQRLTLQTLTRTPDGQGGFTETWSDAGNLWASVEPMKGYERFQAQQMQTPVTHKIILRYRNDVTTANRLKLGTRVFDVKEALNPGEANQFLHLKALEQA